jgi:hypothetical protein
MTKSPHQINTWEHAKKWYENLTADDCNNYPVRNGLESSWVEINKIQGGVVKRRFCSSQSPLQDFIGNGEFGFRSSPEVFMTIIDSFNYYFEKRGSVSLEEIFFGRETAGVGNQSARDSNSEFYHHLSYLFHQQESLNERGRHLGIMKPKTSKVAIVQKLLDSNRIDKNAESILRSYRRWDKKRRDDKK